MFVSVLFAGMDMSAWVLKKHPRLGQQPSDQYVLAALSDDAPYRWLKLA